MEEIFETDENMRKQKLSPEAVQRRKASLVRMCSDDVLRTLHGCPDLAIIGETCCDGGLITTTARSSQADGTTSYHHFFYDIEVEDESYHRLGQTTNTLWTIELSRSFFHKAEDDTPVFLVLCRDARAASSSDESRYYFLTFYRGEFNERQSTRLFGDISDDMTITDCVVTNDGEIILKAKTSENTVVTLRYDNGRTEITKNVPSAGAR